MKKIVSPMFVYAARPRTQHYRPRIHKEFQCLVTSPESAEAHKLLKSIAALAGVPMCRLHKLSARMKRKLKKTIGKKLATNECHYLMNNMLDILT